jgi:hypothetical protein
MGVVTSMGVDVTLVKQFVNLSEDVLTFFEEIP